MQKKRCKKTQSCNKLVMLSRAIFLGLLRRTNFYFWSSEKWGKCWFGANRSSSTEKSVPLFIKSSPGNKRIFKTSLNESLHSNEYSGELGASSTVPRESLCMYSEIRKPQEILGFFRLLILGENVQRHGKYLENKSGGKASTKLLRRSQQFCTAAPKSHSVV